MTDERIDIEIVDKVSANVSKKVIEIANAARLADNAVLKLKNQLSSVDVNGLAKLASASSKVTNSLARETNASARLTSANARMRDSNNRAALSQQKLATETQRTAAAQSRAAATAQNATAATYRAEIASIRLKNAQDKLNNSINRSNRSLGSIVKTAAAFGGIGFSAVGILRSADSYTILENKIKNVVDTEKQLVAVTNEVFEVARRTRTPVQDTAQAFQRFDLALSQLGASQRESLELTETVNKALINSGSTTNEQSSALLQLSQAFNKGKLDGDEFRTVMELMPSVADAIAKQLKVTRGELLELSPQGKITADVMRKAFANAREEIGDKFAKTIPTLGQSFTVLKNEATQFFGEVNKNLGVTAAMSRGILFLADNIKLVSIGLGVLTSALLVAFGPAIISGILATTSAVKGFTFAIAANPLGALIVGLTTAIALFSVFKDDIKVSEDGVVSLGDTSKATFELMSESAAPAIQFFREGWNIAFNEVEARQGTFVGIFGKALGGIFDVTKIIINGYIGIWVGAYNSILKGWGLFPLALKDIVGGAFNSVISVTELGINGVLAKLKTLLNLANEAAEFLGLNPSFNTDFDVDLSRFKTELSGAASELSGVFSDEFSKSFNTDFVGNATKAISERARKIANQRIAEQKNVGSLRSSGAGQKTSLPSDELKQALKRTDALDRVNRKLDSQLGILSLLGPERETQQKLDQITNRLLNRKIILTDAESSSIENKLVKLQREKGIQKELQGIYESSLGSYQQLADGLEASNRAYEKGIINASTYANKLIELNAQAANLRLTLGDATWADVFLSSLSSVTEGYQGSLPAMSEAFGNLFTTLSDGFANSIGQAIVYSEDLSDSLREIARSALSELISSIVKMGVQWVITEGLKQSSIAATTTATAAQATTVVAAAATSTAAQTAALATTTTASVASAATTATAWTPAAATASIGSFGGAAAIGIAALVAALALAKGGFEKGGYTGNQGRKEIAGVVHGSEYVMNAATTQRIGVGNLEALQRGAASIQQGSQSGGSSGQSSNTSPASAATGDSGGTTVNLKTINLVDSSMLSDYLDSSDSDEVFINKISRNSEQIRRSLNG